MAEFWAREEKVDAIQWTGENKEELRRLIEFDFDVYDGEAAVRETAHYAWVDIEVGDYVVVNELEEISVLSEREFTKRYYRRPLQ